MSDSISHSTSDVFGLSRDLPLNYVERKRADDLFINNLSRKQHLVIYGSSKQGKTSLRKHCLDPDEYIVIHCSNKWELSDIHHSILKKAGFELTLSNSLSVSGANKVIASIAANFFGNRASATVEDEKRNEKKEESKPLELDPLDVNDIISALDSINFSKFIVLEDFHYLPVDAQKDFSVALKAFHENSKFSFIIIGVWLEENRLSVYNGDLTGRLLPINADLWKKSELSDVISVGEKLLNISFHQNFKDDLLESCFDSVYLVQESCRICCEKSQIFQTQMENRLIGEDINCREIIKQVVNQQGGRFNSFLTQFSEGFQDTTLEMHKWILYPIISGDISKLENGYTQAEIRSILINVHPRGEDLNPGNVTQSLQSVTSLQIKKDIKPMILDYDQTNLRLNIVDKSFLIWLTHQNRNDLLELVGLPNN